MLELSGVKCLFSLSFSFSNLLPYLEFGRRMSILAKKETFMCFHEVTKALFNRSLVTTSIY